MLMQQCHLPIGTSNVDDRFITFDKIITLCLQSQRKVIIRTATLLSMTKKLVPISDESDQMVEVVAYIEVLVLLARY